ncbi:helix-turn-helix transcriptional regulator [Actimicrobium antarcticum]|uniref:helix-turn-helix transcriptional regulator n=1 Tax=Actimicrobium antarcticum TaxID=1051899 RepID=UPI0031D0F0CB
MNKEIDVQLRIKTVAEVTGLSKPSIYRLMKLGVFPRPRRVGISAVAWSSAAIVAYIDSRSAA